MRTVKTDVAFRHKDVVESLRAATGGWRALHFQFALLKKVMPVDDLHKVTFGIINNEMADKDGYIFFFSDDDVVLLCTSVPKKTLEEIVREIRMHIPDHALLGLEMPFDVTYDLSVSWEALYDLAREKLAAATARLETHGEEKQSESSFVSKGDDDLLIRRIERRKTTILLVEDDPLSLHIARKALMTDFTVVTADDGAAARTAYLTHAPDVVFLDIGLPDMTGHQVLHNLLAVDPAAYIVMLSANSTREDIMKAMQGGAKGFVGKPFSRAKLLQYIAQAPTYTAPASAAAL